MTEKPVQSNVPNLGDKPVQWNVVCRLNGEIELLTLIESTGKMTHILSYMCRSQVKIFTFLWKKQDVKKQ